MGRGLSRSGGNVSARNGADVLFSGKFNSMFSMLFAIGFTIQLERLEARDPARTRRDLPAAHLWLFVFGVDSRVRVLDRRRAAHLRSIRSGAARAAPCAGKAAVDVVRRCACCILSRMGLYRLVVFTPEDREYIVAIEKPGKRATTPHTVTARSSRPHASMRVKCGSSTPTR